MIDLLIFKLAKGLFSRNDTVFKVFHSINDIIICHAPFDDIYFFLPSLTKGVETDIYDPWYSVIISLPPNLEVSQICPLQPSPGFACVDPHIF